MEFDTHLTNCKPVYNSPGSVQHRFRPIKSDLWRLATFRQWKENAKCNISPTVLAKAGFHYTGKSDKVQCKECELEIESWKSWMDPRQEHMNRRPECRFVQERQELFAKNDATSSFLNFTGEKNDTTKSENRITIDNNSSTNVDNKIPKELKISLSLSTEAIDRARIYTLSNWPSITPSAQDMANAGWWYTNIADRVICIYCDAMFHNWHENDKPYEIHRLKSPECFFIRSNEQKSNNRIRQLAVPIPTTNQVPQGQAIVGAVHADYAAIFKRRETFRKWPETKPQDLPSIELFIDAGFFYTGESTIVRCFYCNGALRNWQTGDDPKIEHARWFPKCAYIRQFIGEDLYQAVQRKSRELQAQKHLQENYKSENGSPLIPWTDDEIDRMVKARLDLPVVEKLRDEKFSMAIIRKVFEMQLRFKKDDFKTDVDLRIACIILDKQVKLINGNEANILVPATWMKNYIEEQAKTISFHSSQSSPTSETSNIPSTKSVIMTTTRARLSTKTEEQTLCLLCLSTERQVACLPCGHLTSCVACGHSLKTCPVCRVAVKAFVRIYM